jgi:RNA polymerase sigma factor (sigma-70 family)
MLYSKGTKMSRVLRDDEENWLNRCEAGDETARDEIVLAFQPMVRDLVEKALRRNGFFTRQVRENMRSDLQQAGVLGLLKAFDRFDRKKGCRFSTYAHPYARKEIDKAIKKEREYQGREQKDNIVLQEDYAEPAATRSIYELDLDRRCLLDELAGKLTRSELRVCRLLIEDENMSNVEIGRIMGVTRERIRQIRQNLRSSPHLRSILRDTAV